MARQRVGHRNVASSLVAVDCVQQIFAEHVSLSLVRVKHFHADVLLLGQVDGVHHAIKWCDARSAWNQTKFSDSLSGFSLRLEHVLPHVGDATKWTLHEHLVAHILGEQVVAQTASVWELFAGRVALDDKVNAAFLIQRRDWSVGSRNELTAFLFCGLKKFDVVAGGQATDPVGVRESEAELPRVVANLRLLRDLQLKLVVLVLGDEVKKSLTALGEIEILSGIFRDVHHSKISL